jgi:alcohol dehydrogenase, propanol-preferring
MKAAVVREFGQPLVIEDRPIPEPGPGQITVRMEASGLCHTDIHAASGDWPVKPAPPFVPGHEGVGPIHAIGHGVDGLKPRAAGGRAMAGLRMRHLQALPNRLGDSLPAAAHSGYAVDGCYAEYFLAEAAFAARVPDGVGSFDAAPLSCAGVTTYKAVKVGNVRPTDLVAISGVGGLGHLAVQYAKIFGGTVAAIDVTDEKLQLAKDLGADFVIDARTQDPAAALQAHGGADVAIGWPSTTSRSPPPTRACAAADGWCWSRCPRPGRSASRSSTRC